jgi:hypothetical protein
MQECSNNYSKEKGIKTKGESQRYMATGCQAYHKTMGWL